MLGPVECLKREQYNPETGFQKVPESRTTRMPRAENLNHDTCDIFNLSKSYTEQVTDQ